MKYAKLIRSLVFDLVVTAIAAVVAFVVADVMQFHHPDWLAPQFLRASTIGVSIVTLFGCFASTISRWDERD